MRSWDPLVEARHRFQSQQQGRLGCEWSWKVLYLLQCGRTHCKVRLGREHLQQQVRNKQPEVDELSSFARAMIACNSTRRKYREIKQTDQGYPKKSKLIKPTIGLRCRRMDQNVLTFHTSDVPELARRCLRMIASTTSLSMSVDVRSNSTPGFDTRGVIVSSKRNFTCVKFSFALTKKSISTSD